MNKHQYRIASFLFLFSASVLSSAQEPTIAARWDCFEFLSDSNVPIIKTWVYKNPNGEPDAGRIEANGIRKEASYYQQGISHRWNFDLDLDNYVYKSAFVIKPDGDGLYYYYGSEDFVAPSLRTKCKKTK
ncbi:hypothetical protein [Candidatus Spongiihabitans sp.]|uniref:hypothetical protein n=1 Tax=Candidatus Spongiihabitans sp. TaxID=3101308 RepID=UPI003C7E28CC